VTLRLAVLASGSGSNLQAIIDAIESKRLDAQIAVVFSNVADAYALERAKIHKIECASFSHKAFLNRESFDQAVVDLLDPYQVDIVVLAGYMRIVTTTLLARYPQRVVNIHPALLPAFVGTHAQRQALEYGVKVTGCTVHFVDAGTDTGPIIAQRAVLVDDNDTEATLTTRILAQEHILLPEVLQWLAEARVRIVGRRTLILPRPAKSE
jgi:phosphoribosylglycinamide formyltransferase-1